MIKSYWQQMRPKQWAKNFIVFIPLLFSSKVTILACDYAAAMTFASFCLLSSAVYTINDLIDKQSDINHPLKKSRPIASGAIGQAQGIAFAIGLAVAGLCAGFIVRPSLSLVLAAYLGLNLAYTFSWKRVAIIDVLCISIGFVLRAVAGALAVQVQPSEWFLLCTTLGAMFLALEKRRHELLNLGDGASNTRSTLNDYSVALLMRMEGVILPSLITCYAFYSFLSFHGKQMMLTIPFVLYGIMRYQNLSERAENTGAPEDIFWRDRGIQIALAGWLMTSLLVIYGDPISYTTRVFNVVDSEF